MKSFRIRIIIWTTVIAGAVMLGFGIAGNLAFERIKLQQVDDALRSFSERPDPPPIHSRYWNRTGPEVVAELGKRFGSEAVVAVYGRGWKSRAGGESNGPEDVIVYWGELKNLFPTEAELPKVEGLFEPIDERARGMPPGLGSFSGRERGPRFDGPPVVFEQFSKVSLADGSHWRMALAKHDGYSVLVGLNLEKVREDSALMVRAFAVAFPIALVAMALCIWIYVTKAISPIRRLSETIESVSAQSLGARLESAGEYSEFASLIEHFNGMLERLGRSFTQATRFSADAAHELKTPIAILQGQLEVALQRAPDGSDEQHLLAGLLDETQRLKSITRKLLILAKADAGSLDAQRDRVDIRRLTEELIGLSREDDPSVELELSLEAEDFEALCDETLSRQILNNLIGNALKYRSPADASIGLRLRETGSSLVWEISNPCEPMDAETRRRLFDRFIRGDAARNRSVDGTGLGLSLSLEFARAQGGTLTLVETAGTDEMRIRLELPRYESSRPVD